VSTQSYVSPWLYPLVSTGNRLFLQRFFFRDVVITGRSHLPSLGPVVWAVKHYSRWDPLVIGILGDHTTRYMTNANQFEGIQGWFIRRLGAFPVNLARPQKSSLQHTIELLHQGQTIIMFPEGGIVRDQLLRPLKSGLARLILQAESTAAIPLVIPIVPIAIHYVPEAQRGATVYMDIAPSFTSKAFTAGSEKQRAALMTTHLETVLRERLQALRDASSEFASV
jgi:1-acyl-sn-glycerol-3-phosphate acyltransferase